MPLSAKFKELIEKTFTECHKNTRSSRKKKALQDMQVALLKMEDQVAYDHLLEAITNKDNDFFQKIDIETNLFSKLTTTPTKTRVAMIALQRQLSQELARSRDDVSRTLLMDTQGKGFGKVLPGAGDGKPRGFGKLLPGVGGTKKLATAYDFTSSAKSSSKDGTLVKNESEISRVEEAHFLSKGTLFNFYNRSGLDYKGQVNYAGLTLLRGGGFDFKVDVLGLAFPPAATLGFEGTVGLSAQALKGRQALIYSEVVNGCNGKWVLPSAQAIKAKLIENLTNELVALNKLNTNQPNFFDAKQIQTGLKASLPADSLDDPAMIITELSGIKFLDKDQKEYSTEKWPDGQFAPNICEAVEIAQSKTRSDLSKLDSSDFDYNALIFLASMRSTKVWDWKIGGGVELGWSPLHVEAWNDVTKFLNTTDSTVEGMQYIPLGLTCSASAGLSIGRRNRSFWAGDANARLVAKGSNKNFDKSYEQLSRYVTDSIRFESEEDFREYLSAEVYKIANFEMASFKKDSLRKCALTLEGLASQINALNAKLKASDVAKLEINKQKIEHLKYLRERINCFEFKDDNEMLGRSFVAYTGTTWEFSASANAKLGAEFRFGSEQTGSVTFYEGSLSSLLEMTKAHRSSRYTIQVPVLQDSSRLPDLLKDKLSGNGMCTIQELHENGEPDGFAFKTQETIVGYRQIEKKFLIGAELSTDIKVRTKEKEKKIFNRESDSGDTFFNTIEYSTATAVWKKDGQTDNLKLLPGSGRSYGQAFLLGELMNLAYAVTHPPVTPAYNAKLTLLARSLRITTSQLEVFFRSNELRKSALNPSKILTKEQRDKFGNNPWAPENFAAQAGCILIESTFARKDPTNFSIPRAVPKKGKEIKCCVPESPLKASALPDVNPDMPGIYSLQSIKVRYRIADLKEDESTPFKLGIFFLGKFELGIRLQEVENVGMSGVVDVFTYWTDQHSSGSTMYNRDETVQGTVLITQ